MSKFFCDTYSYQGPQCPYCAHTLTADEPGYYDERSYTEDHCPKCGKTFEVEVEQTIAWICRPIDDEEDADLPTAADVRGILKEPQP